jgi:hypothetical protein
MRAPHVGGRFQSGGTRGRRRGRIASLEDPVNPVDQARPLNRGPTGAAHSGDQLVKSLWREARSDYIAHVSPLGSTRSGATSRPAWRSIPVTPGPKFGPNPCGETDDYPYDPTATTL